MQGDVATQSTATVDLRISQVGEGSLLGTLLDPDSKPVSGALITASKRSTNPSAKYTSYTDGRGHFYFSLIAVGEYDLSVESRDPWLNDTSTVVSIRPSERTDVRIVLELNTACDRSPGDLNKSDKAEIAATMLQEFFKTNGLDPSLVHDKQVVLSTKELESIQISNPPEFKMILLTPQEIQAKADRQGDFMYLQFENFETRGACVAVKFDKLWADGTSTIETGKRTLMGDQSLFYLFQKRAGKWVAKFLTGTIT